MLQVNHTGDISYVFYLYSVCLVVVETGVSRCGVRPGREIYAAGCLCQRGLSAYHARPTAAASQHLEE